MPTTADYISLATPPIALLTGVYTRFGNLVKATMWSDLCQCNGNPSGTTCNNTAPWGSTTLTNYAVGSPRCIGTSFTPASNMTIEHVQLFIGTGWVNATTAYLWDLATNTLLHTLSIPAASLVAGMNTYPVSPSWSVTGGHQYLLNIDGSGGNWFWSAPSTWTANPNATWGSGYAAFSFGSIGTVQPGNAWTIYPELCTPGGPPTIPPDPTPPTPPTGFPTYPGPSACGSFNDVCVAIGMLQSQVAAIGDQVRLIRNYEVPFGLVDGTDHPGLSGSGSFSIGGVLGLRIRVTGGAGSPVLAGNPPYVMNQGWVSIDDGSGMYTEKRVTQTSFLWFPPNCQLATSFNWALNPGITIDVLELLAEP